MLFLCAEAKSEFTEEVENHPQEDTDPEIQKKSPIEGEDLVVKDVRKAVFEDVVDGIAPDDGHKYFGKFADEDFHEPMEVILEFRPPNYRGRSKNPNSRSDLRVHLQAQSRDGTSDEVCHFRVRMLSYPLRDWL
jgi:hypothetical protein